MSLIWDAVIIVVVTCIAVLAMLVARRRAPDGGYFNDGDRAAGVFGVLATGFTLLLGFVVFLAFTSYDASRVGAESEALTVAQQVETAQFFPAEFAGELTGQLVCYARAVVHIEWPQMEAGELSSQLNPWGIVLFNSLQKVEPESNSQQSAYDKWLDQTSDREEARRDRIHGAEGILPTPLWVGMFVIGALVFVFMLFFADSGERAFIQALLIGTVTAVMATLLLLLGFLSDPFGPDGLRPVAMERTLDMMDQAMQVTSFNEPIPCDATGNPL